MSSNGSVAGLTSRPAKIADYIAIMRLDHATKHVFVVPGIILALLLRGSQVHITARSFVAGALVAVLIASANYVINEWLDRDSDAVRRQNRRALPSRFAWPDRWFGRSDAS
jgi:4-hydroxybenzoate polyprenyltransferase